MAWRLLSAPLKVLAPLKRVGYRLLIAAGVGVATLFIAFGLLVDLKSLSVLLAALGAALGALIVGLTLPKLLVVAGTQREKQLSEALTQAVVEQSRLATEIERVKAQQLQFQQVQTVLRLTLLEVDATLTDFKKESLGWVERALGGAEEHHYVGVLRKRVKVLLGMDLARLRVREEGMALIIDGLHAEFQGVRDEQEDWLLRQVQVTEDNWVMSNKTRVLHDDGKLLSASSRQQADLLSRLHNGVELKSYDLALVRLGEQWLRAILSPTGLHVKVGVIAEGDGQAFMTFLQSRMSDLSQERQRLEAAVAVMPTLNKDMQ